MSKNRTMEVKNAKVAKQISSATREKSLLAAIYDPWEKEHRKTVHNHKRAFRKVHY